MSTQMRRPEQIEIVRTLGQRLKAARELCGYSQQKAAMLLGYVNSSKLAKIEAASDTHSVPLWMIPRAAAVYQVSIDFLFGISDDWDRNALAAQEKQISRWLDTPWQQVKAAQDDAIRSLYAKQAELTDLTTRTLRRAKENLACVLHVQQNNKAFDTLRGGAKLLRLLAETAEDAMGLGMELEKLRTLAEAERVIGDILENPRHPVNDPKHPAHEQAKQAFDELKSNLAESRAGRGVEQGSTFEKQSKSIK